MICYYYSDPVWWIFTSELPQLLYYSHITVFSVTLFVGLFVLFYGRKFLLNKLLFFLSLSFAAWVFINLVVWGSNNSNLTMSVWPYFGTLQAAIAMLSIYLIYVFLFNKDISFKLKLLLTGLALPVILFAPTDLTVNGFNLAWCDAFEYENVVMLTYYSLLGFVAMLWIAILSIKEYIKPKDGSSHRSKTEILLMGIGIETFLFLFFFLTYIGSLLAGMNLVDDSELEFYAIFGMGIFIVILGILSVRFRIFNIGLVASQALVLSLIILVGSQFTFSTSTTSIVLTAITLVLVGFVGIILIRSVKKEIKQRQELEILTKQLESANDRLKELDKLKSEFVSIASHQLRSPITAIRGYASMLIEGSYGKIPKKATEALERIENSSKLMAGSIEDYLNISRIESGNMKYNKADFNLRDEVEHVCDDLRSDAMKQGLVLIFRTDLNSRGVINADIGKTVQIIQNLITNSIKYTKKGTIKVFVHDDITRKKIFVDVVDTGIGMNEKTLESIFQKFERADNANLVNIKGTGLGLFVALKMAEGMGGKITAHSEGDEKGSRFTLELPLAM